MNLTKTDIETTVMPPDQQFLSLSHEYLRPELRPIPSNTFYSRTGRTLEDQLMREKVLKGKATHTVNEARRLLAEKKAQEAAQAQQQEIKAGVQKWNEAVERKRSSKQQRKLLKRFIKQRGDEHAV